MVEEGDLKPWDRQPGETAKAYAAFTTYRDMGSNRTVRATAEALTKSEQLIKGWSGKHKWVARVSAWDSLPGQKVAEAYEDMAARIAAQHERLATKLLDRLEHNLESLPRGADPSIKWSTAHTAAHRGHSFAADLSKPRDTAREEIAKQVAALIEKLAGDE